MQENCRRCTHCSNTLCMHKVPIFGNLDDIRMLTGIIRKEHEAAGEVLRKLRQVTNNYRLLLLKEYSASKFTGKEVLIMDKVIDLSKTVYDLCSGNPEIKDILMELGFKDIGTPGVIQTAGRFMTIPKGAAMKRIELEIVKEAFRKHGYRVIE